MPDRITRIAIFEKQGLFGVISVDTNVLNEEHEQEDKPETEQVKLF